MKILGSDYDGTLTVGGIDQTKCDAIRIWREHGHKIGLVSGRGPAFLQQLKNEYPRLSFDFFVAFNGAVITDSEGLVLFKTECTDLSVPTFVGDLLAYGCPFVFVNSHDFYFVRKNEAELQNGEYTLSDLPTDLSTFVQISVQLETFEEAMRITELIKSAYGDKLNPLQNGICIDIVSLGVNKAYGLQKIMSYYGAAHEDVIAVGDNLNDMDMIREFRSYAMENGAEAVKRAASYTTGSVTELIQRELATEAAHT